MKHEMQNKGGDVMPVREGIYGLLAEFDTPG